MITSRRSLFAFPLVALPAGALFFAGVPRRARAADLAPLTVLEAWARATPPGARTAAAYLTIANPGSESDRLLAVSTEAAGRVQLHMHEITDGVARMRPVEALDVPAGGRLVLQPDGAHLMLFDLRRALEAGGQLVLTLRFAKAGEIAVTAQILAPGSGGPALPPHHHPG